MEDANNYLKYITFEVDDKLYKTIKCFIEFEQMNLRDIRFRESPGRFPKVFLISCNEKDMKFVKSKLDEYKIFIDCEN